MAKVRVYVCPNELESWNTLWRWMWFTRDSWESKYWKEERIAVKPLLSLLRKLKVKSVLDCSCGLGYKTVLVAKAGYEVEGSDGSPVAIRFAPLLAEENGLKIRFFTSLYNELSERCKRKYDCVLSDNIDEISTREGMKIAAKNVHAVLNEGGKLIFSGIQPKLTRKDLKREIEKVWKKRKHFSIEEPPYEKGGIRVTRVEVNEKTSEGILENNIFLIEEKGKFRVEIAPIMNPRIKWTYRDYYKVLKEAGFKKVYYAREGFIVAIK
ncbi:hypothetical protein DRN62_00130 [Nanoarchaeota archaeon]|nr:MAG: hypothetical protein DRN62_00130 [Nanoarchaeota archaeon]